MKNLLFISLCTWCSLSGVAQGDAQRFGLDPLGKDQEYLHSSGSELHGQLQPFVERMDESWYKRDSSSTADSQRKFSIRPLGQLSAGYSLNSSEDGAVWQTGPGFNARLHLSDRWDASLSYRAIWERPPGYLSGFAAENRVLPGVGYATVDSLDYFAHYYEGHVGYQAGKYFHFELGRGKHFWGDGYRSLLLSHNAAPYPYFRMDTKVWRLKLTNLIGQFDDLQPGMNFGDIRKKYGALHALSWNISPKVNVSVYEMVIWQDRDSLSDRGLELNYLHPILFFRPVEYAQGSADNVLLGFSTRIKSNTGQEFYGSVMLDEFLFNEVKNDLGWWANKYGIQAGIKSFNTFVEGLHFQLEGSLVRPFTYSHGSRVQAYGHLNQGLAHPLNTNFRELVFMTRYNRGIWSFLFTASVAEFGRDTETENYGGDLFQSYVDPFRKYGNYLTQGVHHALWIQRLECSRKAGNFGEYFAELQWRSEFIEGNGLRDLFFQVGIRTSMLKPYRDF